MTRAQLDMKTCIRIVRDIAGALDYAHRQGVAHRDVKPENILLRADGSCVLSDFGIAHAAESQGGLTREGTSVGTPHYMSPEQLRGERTDGRSDLYSLGVLMYQLLTGELPFQGSDGWAIGMQHIMAPVPKFPPAFAHLQELLETLLAKDPAQRMQSGGEVVRWIDAHITLTPAMTMAMPTPRGANLTSGGSPVANSIAVLPFADMSAGRDQEYFSDGLAEEILNLLAKVPNLPVAGRTASFSFKGRNANLAEIGRELKVANVLEGSVRKIGERVRISVQLIKIADGFNLWSETYDRQLTDVFAIQEEIATAAVAAIRAKLAPAEIVSPPIVPTISPVPEAAPSPLPSPPPEPVVVVPEPKPYLDSPPTVVRAAVSPPAEPQAGKPAPPEPRPKPATEPVAAKPPLSESEPKPAPVVAKPPEPRPEPVIAQPPVPELTPAPVVAKPPPPESKSEPVIAKPPVSEPTPEPVVAIPPPEPKPTTAMPSPPSAPAPVPVPELAPPAAASPPPPPPPAKPVTPAPAAAAKAREPAVPDKAAGDAEAVPQPVSDLVSAFETRSRTSARPKPAASGSRLLPTVAIAVPLLLLLGWGLLKVLRPGEDPAARCQLLLADAQSALQGSDFARAATAANDAEAICAAEQLVQVQALKVLIRDGQAKMQACEASEAAAKGLLDQARPAEARTGLEQSRAQCAGLATFESLSQRAVQAMAEANSLVNQARAKLQADKPDEAQPLLERALQLDSLVPGSAVLLKEVERRRTRLARDTKAPTTVPPAPVVMPPPATATAAAPPPRPTAAPVVKPPPTTAPATTTAAPSPRPAPATPAATPAAPAPTPTVPVEPVAAPEPAAPRLVPVSTPAPDYPAAARRSRTAGEVVASFTVRADGGVTNIRIVSARPRGVFERSVQAALRDWRFQPISQPHTMTRTFKFEP
jgi:TonB family protein